jgi:hypothetical protein
MNNKGDYKKNVYLCSMEENKLLYTIYNLGPEFITWEQPFDLSEVKRAALLNAEMPMLIMAICCQYGILTEVSMDLAVYFYRSLIERYKNFYAYINLGVLYVEANYLHTALRLFEKADKQRDNIRPHLDGFDLLSLLKNIESCRQLLSLPFEERPKRIFLKHSSPETNNPWKPDDPLRVDPADYEEQKQATKRLEKDRLRSKYQHDDFVFTSIRVKIRDERACKDQHDLVFLERYRHEELNEYIQQHLAQLRSAFQKCGYHLRYLPSHAQNLNDISDKAYYCNMYGDDVFETFHRAYFVTQSDYWNAFFDMDDDLLYDCAGFLRCVPEAKTDSLHYEFIRFPHRPGTIWERAFTAFLDHVSGLPFIKIPQKRTLPPSTTLYINKEYNIFLRDSDGVDIAEIKLKALPKALYFVFLNHPEGFPLKHLIDYREELLSWYRKLSNRKKLDKSIDDLTDPTNNSANEKISRIGKVFRDAVKNCDDSIEAFIPTGSKGEVHTVHVDRGHILWNSE